MTTNTGGPAFPHHVVCDKGWAETQKLQGMTLRDYFAAKAMQGIVSDPSLTFGVDKVAEWAYAQADAMIAARES